MLAAICVCCLFLFVVVFCVCFVFVCFFFVIFSSLLFFSCFFFFFVGGGGRLGLICFLSSRLNVHLFQTLSRAMSCYIADVYKGCIVTEQSLHIHLVQVKHSLDSE